MKKYMLISLFLLGCTAKNPGFYYNQKLKLTGFYKGCSGTIENQSYAKDSFYVRVECPNGKWNEIRFSLEDLIQETKPETK